MVGGVHSDETLQSIQAGDIIELRLNVDLGILQFTVNSTLQVRN